jgi:hypothetical protein
VNKRLTSGVVAAVVAIGMSVPAVGFANKGGKPHSLTKPCFAHKHGRSQHNGTSRHTNGRGKKCGKQ